MTSIKDTPSEEDDSKWESLQPSTALQQRPVSNKNGSDEREKTKSPTMQLLSALMSPSTDSQTTTPSRSPRNELAIVQQALTSARDEEERSLALQQRFQDKRCLKERLVRHPLKLFWSRFLAHFARELWGVDVHIRLALLLIVTGALIRLGMAWTVLWTAVISYPRALLAGVVLSASCIYLNQSYFEQRVKSFLYACSSLEAFANALGRIDEQRLRHISIGLLFVPTLLDLRTFQFLTVIVCEEATYLKVILVAALIMIIMRYIQVKKHLHPRECTHKGMIVLYGAALISTVLRFDIWHMPHVAGPFLFSTGVLLLALRGDDDMEWFSLAVRQALRFTLRDVLEKLGADVKEDEMLQLAMLRWIADYWANSKKPSTTNGSQAASSSKTLTRKPSVAQSVTHTPTSSPSSEHSTTTESTPTAITTVSPTVATRQELKWNDLQPMLSVATEQMASETRTLQELASTANSDVDTAGAPAAPSSTVSSSRSTTLSKSKSKSKQTFKGDSFKELQNMLTSMNLDDRAKPAVKEYKRVVQNFPPERRLAIFVSICRRCPALLLILWQILLSHSLAAIIILIPFSLFEIIRVQEWSEACKQISGCNDGSSNKAEFLDHVDPMVILLSGDRANQMPTLLTVWINICNSVSALEMGLTAVRCAQTTAVATSFAKDMMSLASFGVAVASRGWVYGATVILTDIVLLYRNPDRSKVKSTNLATAALRMVESGKTITHNVQVLKDEESHLFNPLLNVVFTVVGKGWLWGHRHEKKVHKSTVVIEELTDQSDESNSSTNTSQKQDGNKLDESNAIVVKKATVEVTQYPLKDLPGDDKILHHGNASVTESHGKKRKIAKTIVGHGWLWGSDEKKNDSEAEVEAGEAESKLAVAVTSVEPLLEPDKTTDSTNLDTTVSESAHETNHVIVNTSFGAEQSDVVLKSVPAEKHHIASAIIGRGWLWGKEATKKEPEVDVIIEQPITSSTMISNSTPVAMDTGMEIQTSEVLNDHNSTKENTEVSKPKTELYLLNDSDDNVNPNANLANDSSETLLQANEELKPSGSTTESRTVSKRQYSDSFHFEAGEEATNPAGENTPEAQGNDVDDASLAENSSTNEKDGSTRPDNVQSKVTEENATNVLSGLELSSPNSEEHASSASVSVEQSDVVLKSVPAEKHHIASAIIGRGWLWGKEATKKEPEVDVIIEQPITSSTTISISGPITLIEETDDHKTIEVLESMDKSYLNGTHSEGIKLTIDASEILKPTNVSQFDTDHLPLESSSPESMQGFDKHISQVVDATLHEVEKLCVDAGDVLTRVENGPSCTMEAKQIDTTEKLERDDAIVMASQQSAGIDIKILHQTCTITDQPSSSLEQLDTLSKTTSGDKRHFASAIIGRGWLWGNENAKKATKTHIVIGEHDTNGADPNDDTDGVDPVDHTDEADPLEHTNGVDNTDGADLVDHTNGANLVIDTEGANPIDDTDGANDIYGADPVDHTDGANRIDHTDEANLVDSTDRIDTGRADLVDHTDGAEQVDHTAGANPVDHTDGVDPVDDTDGVDSVNETDRANVVDNTDGANVVDDTGGTNAVDHTDEADPVEHTKGVDDTDGAGLVDHTDTANLEDHTDRANLEDHIDRANSVNDTDRVNAASDTDGANAADDTDGANAINHTDEVNPVEHTSGVDDTDGADLVDHTAGADPVDHRDGADPVDHRNGADPVDHRNGADLVDHTDGANQVGDLDGAHPVDHTDGANPTEGETSRNNVVLNYDDNQNISSRQSEPTTSPDIAYNVSSPTCTNSENFTHPVTDIIATDDNTDSQLSISLDSNNEAIVRANKLKIASAIIGRGWLWKTKNRKTPTQSICVNEVQEDNVAESLSGIKDAEDERSNSAETKSYDKAQASPPENLSADVTASAVDTNSSSDDIKSVTKGVESSDSYRDHMLDHLAANPTISVCEDDVQTVTPPFVNSADSEVNSKKYIGDNRGLEVENNNTVETTIDCSIDDEPSKDESNIQNAHSKSEAFTENDKSAAPTQILNNSKLESSSEDAKELTPIVTSTASLTPRLLEPLDLKSTSPNLTNDVIRPITLETNAPSNLTGGNNQKLQSKGRGWSWGLRVHGKNTSEFTLKDEDRLSLTEGAVNKIPHCTTKEILVASNGEVEDNSIDNEGLEISVAACSEHDAKANGSCLTKENNKLNGVSSILDIKPENCEPENCNALDTAKEEKDINVLTRFEDHDDENFEDLKPNVGFTVTNLHSSGDHKSDEDTVLSNSTGQLNGQSFLQQNDYHDNIWMQIGGGLAVLGAVVGGFAVALNDDRSRKHKRHQAE